MKWVLLLMFALCQFAPKVRAVSSQGIPDDKEWNTVTVLEDQGFTVRCKVRKQVNMTENDWLSLEFDNQTGQALHIKSSEFEITQQRSAIGTNRKIAGGLLCSGQFKELLTDILDPVRGMGGSLPAHTKRTQTEYLTGSASGAGLYKLPTPAGDHMQISVKLLIEFADGRKLSTADHGVPLKFDLLPWNTDTIAQAKKRLRSLLQCPKDTTGHHMMVKRLLELDVVSIDLTAADVVDAIKKQKYDTGGLVSLLTFVRNRFPDDPAWLKYQEDISKARQVMLYGKPWNDACVEPVVLYYESHADGSSSFFAVELLYKHKHLWIADKSITTRLSKATIQYFPELDRKLEFLSDNEKKRWIRGVVRLGMCGDQLVIPLMRQGLTDKTMLTELRRFANLGFGNPPPAPRLCDETLRSILILLDDDVKTAYQQADYTSIIDRRGTQDIENQLNQVHDKMIATLKSRLDQLGK